MSFLFETTGIVLSWRPYREHDRWYSVLTREHGKIEFVARGGQKPLAKLTPHLETVAESRLLVVSGHLYYTVAGVERLHTFPLIYGNLTKTVLAQNAQSLVDLGTRTHETDEEMYRLLQRWLTFVETMPDVSADRAGFLLASFALKLLTQIGFGPELNQCLVCRHPIEQGEYRWHALKGGVACLTCTQKDPEQWFTARVILDETLKLIRYSLNKDFADQLRPHLPGEILLAFHEVLESLLIAHFPVIPAASIRESCVQI